MTPERKEELADMVYETINSFIADDLFSIGYWDGSVEYEDLTNEEFEELKKLFDIKFTVNVKEKL